jgi:hypothetical protein
MIHDYKINGIVIREQQQQQQQKQKQHWSEKWNDKYFMWTRDDNNIITSHTREGWILLTLDEGGGERQWWKCQVENKQFIMQFVGDCFQDRRRLNFNLGGFSKVPLRRSTIYCLFNQFEFYDDDNDNDDDALVVSWFGFSRIVNYWKE